MAGVQPGPLKQADVARIEEQILKEQAGGGISEDYDTYVLEPESIFAPPLQPPDLPTMQAETFLDAPTLLDERVRHGCFQVTRLAEQALTGSLCDTSSYTSSIQTDSGRSDKAAKKMLGDAPAGVRSGVPQHALVHRHSGEPDYGRRPPEVSGSSSSSDRPDHLADLNAVLTAARMLNNGGMHTPMTTLMLRNVPGSYPQETLAEDLSECDFDFLYLPMQWTGVKNMNFAFINLTSEAEALACFQKWHKQRLPRCRSRKALTVSFADVQGLYANLANLRKDRFKNAAGEYCEPIIYIEGKRETFAKALVKVQRMQKAEEKKKKQQQPKAAAKPPPRAQVLPVARREDKTLKPDLTCEKQKAPAGSRSSASSSADQDRGQPSGKQTAAAASGNAPGEDDGVAEIFSGTLFQL